MLKLNYCHSCGRADIMIVHRNGRELCPRCDSELFARTIPGRKDLLKRIVPVHLIDFTCHLDKICAQLMAFYLSNGLSISECARQLGITRSTVYATLRRNGLLRPPTQTDIVLNPNLGDFIQAGGTGKQFTLLSVTPESTRQTKSRKKPGESPGPADNAERL